MWTSKRFTITKYSSCNPSVSINFLITSSATSGKFGGKIKNQ